MFHSFQCQVTTRALGECIRPPKHVIINKLENPDYVFLYPKGNPEVTQILMGSKLDQDPSSVFYWNVGLMCHVSNRFCLSLKHLL